VENVKDGDNYKTMTILDRKTIIAEQLIREYVRERLQTRITEIAKNEAKLRASIRQILISEAETGTEEPSTYTGINVLADLLKNIIPTIQDDYMMLTTSKEQRDSFRNHLVHAVKNSLRPIEVTAQAEEAEEMGESIVFEIDADVLTEKVSIDVDVDEPGLDAPESADEFIDIEKEEDKDDFVSIEDQNETGRNFAAETFKRVEKQVVDAYDMLADDQDRDMFYDYLVTNLLLYFDKFEADLATTLPDVTTPEYEEEKDSVQAVDNEEETPDLGLDL
tara:strand:+ start:2192 stop:3022 length:831 start_codon:yes stop_codon:yes gene_type:complete